ncbi:MAG TPA: CGNR zinc finger domain-containing protein [Candidatus Limnocylindria bacterium]|nr:CGNR zinc finger domain-containing protein [Candidatus Limnocylindria bacterium]
MRNCADANCRRLFIDRSRNRTRRWCDMAACGNRAKQRRMRARAVPIVGATAHT